MSRIKCDNEIVKGEKQFSCGRFLGKLEGMVIELKCPNCKKVHRVDINRPIEGKEFIAYLESTLQQKQQ
jgi:phage FluMu protein Com